MFNIPYEVVKAYADSKRISNVAAWEQLCLERHGTELNDLAIEYLNSEPLPEGIHGRWRPTNANLITFVGYATHLGENFPIRCAMRSFRAFSHMETATHPTLGYKVHKGYIEGTIKMSRPSKQALSLVTEAPSFLSRLLKFIGR